MKDSIFVTEGSALQKLIHEAAHCCGIESTTFAVHIHILLEVSVTVLEDENQLGLGVDNIMKSDNVDMFQLLHQRDFADRGRGGSFLGIEVNFLEGNDFVCGPGAALEWYQCQTARGIRDDVPCKPWRMFLHLKHLVSIEERCKGGFPYQVSLAIKQFSTRRGCMKGSDHNTPVRSSSLLRLIVWRSGFEGGGGSRW